MADAMKTRCGCAYCRVRGLMGPVLIITIGVILLFHEYTRYIGDLLPILLIVAGVVLLAQSLASKAGHIAS